MRYLTFFLLFAPFFFGFTHNNQHVTRIAIVDTGLDINDARFSNKLCPAGAQDFTGKGIVDTIGHGTHVAGLIKQYAGDSNYCLIILKYYTNNIPTERSNNDYIEALDSLNFFKPDVVNLSLSGPVALYGEKQVIANLPNAKFFVAAGNDGKNLDQYCDVYPACYAKTLKNITVVGNEDANDTNYGSIVDLWIDGNNIQSTYPFFLSLSGVASLSGTSMSTAIASGLYVHELN